MIPAARIQAAIEVLGDILAGAPAERALTGWGRRSRYAGSKDRAAVRDHVFDALRRLRSSAWIGGQGDRPPEAMEARAVVAGCLAGQGVDPTALFDGSRHGPAPLETWAPVPLEGAPDGVRLDLPDWLLPAFSTALGDDLPAIGAALRHRAPVHLRARGDRDAVIAMLVEAGHHASPHPVSPSAIEVAGAPRGLSAMPAFQDGAFEMQDAGSQALVDRLPLAPGMRVLDLCAGGGGKALAIAARSGGRVHAHDADPARLRDLPGRAARAGADIAIVQDPEGAAPFDLVVCDVPCSGSGAWRRQPEARWRLTPERLAALGAVQGRILDRARGLVAPGGTIAYMTCSLLTAENGDIVDAALARGGLRPVLDWSITPLSGCDGFYLAVLSRQSV